MALHPWGSLLSTVTRPKQNFQYSLCIEHVGLPLLPPLPSSTQLALFVNSHWYAWLYPCERTASNSGGGGREQNRFEANAHTCCRCLWCRNKQAQGMCHQSIARHIFFFPSPTLPLHSFHLLGKKIKNNATVLWSNQRQGNNNDELSCRERSRLGWGCMADDKTRALWDSFTGLAAQCLLRPLRIMQCGTVRVNQKEPPREERWDVRFYPTCPL